MSPNNSSSAKSKSLSDAENNAAQEVNVIVGGDQSNNAVVRNANGDCYGACYMCRRSPGSCDIARQYLPAPEWHNYEGG